MIGKSSIGWFLVHMASAVSLLAAAIAAQAGAAERVALVIGNAAYVHTSQLRTPRNDATDVARALRMLDFRVIEGLDLDKVALERKVREFAGSAKGAEAALLFYAGHGLQVDGENYLVLVDSKLASEVGLDLEVLKLRAILEHMKSAVNLVFLDACRNNPLGRSLARSMGETRSRAVTRGLGRVAANGTMFAFATQPGNVADDSDGRNSAFTGALLQHLAAPDTSIEEVMILVTDTVLRRTNKRQQPWRHSSLREPFYFVPGRIAGSATPAKPEGGKGDAVSLRQEGTGNGFSGRVTSERDAKAAYDAAKDLDTVEAYNAVIERYSNSVYASFARVRIRKLEATARAAERALDLQPADRRLIQSGLASLGFDPGPADGAFGPADGAFGPATRAALKAWQAATGLAATGWLTASASSTLKTAGTKAERDRLDREWPAGKTFRDCADCPEMAVVPAGSFTMGSPSDETGRDKDEGPQRRVTIRHRFAVGKYEVTFDEWDACVSAGGCGPRPDDQGWGRGRRPVLEVSWHDAKQYVRWLSDKTGKRYRLLSAAEWEYAARAGTTTRYHWGDHIGHNRAHCRDCGSRWNIDRTAPVGSFAPNRFGLHDMHGNVWEWVDDCWHGSYRGAPSDGSAWTAGGDCARRMLRGGSWDVFPEDLRAAVRIWFWAHTRLVFFGFRVVRTLSP